ncbi:MAG: oligosaccharide flippase family protein, partial [Pseudomonadota bacterium]
MASRSLFTNAASMVSGRIALSVGRFAAMVLVARFAGVEAYGAYAILLATVALCEWLADFGQTDIAVRDASQSDHVGAVTVLARLKWITGPAAAAALVAFIILAGYPRAMIEAGCAGAFSVLLAAAIQPARARLRLEGRQHLDVLAEIIGLGVTLPALAALLALNQPLWTYVAAFALGRAVQGTILIASAPFAAPSETPDGHLSQLARSAFPLGVIGVIVLAYELAAPVVLSKLMSLEDVGYFMAA